MYFIFTLVLYFSLKGVQECIPEQGVMMSCLPPTLKVKDVTGLTLTKTDGNYKITSTMFSLSKNTNRLRSPVVLSSNLFNTERCLLEMIWNYFVTEIEDYWNANTVR